MIRSMTGFGRAEGSAEGYALTVEIKSVNHRHLDVALRLPTALSSLDLDARRLVQARVERGRVDVTAQLGPAAGRAAQEVRVDAALARRYVGQARTVGRDLGVGGERLRERLRTMLADASLDETRIITEVAVWAQKTDVTEELARLRAHLEDLGAKLDKGGPVGRPLDFLIQELNREVNTLGAKADDLELSQAALAAKGMLEKMREQVQNLE